MAFDLFKTSLIELLDKLLVLIKEHPEEEIPEDKVKINIVHTSKVIQAKFENKLIKMLEDTPYPQKVVLEILNKKFQKGGIFTMNAFDLFNQCSKKLKDFLGIRLL